MKNTSSIHTLKRLLSTYLPRHKTKLIIAFVAMLVVSVTMSLSAYYIQPLFDGGLINRRIGVLNTVIIALIGLTFIKGIAYYYQGFYMEWVGQSVIADLQKDLFKKIIAQDLRFYQTNPTATLTARFISDLQRLKASITQIFHAGVRDTAVIIGLLANMIYQDWQLTLLALVVFPLSFFPIRQFGRLMRKYARLNQESIGRLSHKLNESFHHVRQVQAFTMENHEQSRTNNHIDDVFNTTVRAVRVRAISSPTVELIGTIAIGLIMLYAGYRIADGALTPGAFASFMASAVIIIRPIKGLTNLNNILQEGLSAADRTFALMDEPRRVQNKPNAKPLTVTKGDITFKDITLTYPDGKTALESLTLTLPAGKTVALVGSSGAGKSTLLNLIPRFFDPTEGHIEVDGQNIKHADLTSLREHIALVTQDVAIFDDTAAANIAYGNKNATEADIIQAAKDAAAHDFIDQLPEGYNTNLGENGVKLSGGQKQRIAIARALVSQSPILLLDEATSNLDTVSERKVQKALEKLMQNRTTLVIAHRLSTITAADNIVVLNNGQIAEQGTHTQLLKKRQKYDELWRMQQK